MFARTSRLLLRPGWQEDARALHAAMADESIVRNLATAPWPYTLADAEAFLAREPDALLPRLLVFNRTQGRPLLVGGVGLSVTDEPDTFELGYWIARPYWGLGFATEAASAVMRMGRASGIKRIIGSHFVDNPASGRVLRKAGLRPTGDFVRRYSAGRGGEALSATYEDADESDMRSDVSMELYDDAATLAAA